MVVVDVVIDIARTLQHQIAVQTSDYLVFLKESCTSIAQIDAISKSGTNFIEKNVRMSIGLHPNTYFLVKFHKVVADF